MPSVCYFSRGMTQNVILSEEEYQTHSADALVRKSCNELGLTCYDIKYRYGSYFSKNLIKYRDVFKDPNRYHELLDNHDALQDFYRILFIAHRPLENAIANKSPRGWNQLVDNVIDLVEKYGYVPLLPCMQVVLGRQASPELKRKVEVAVDACRNKFSYE